MKRYFVLLCGLLLCANSIRAELVSVKLYQDPEQNADYIKKEYTGNQENLAACWGGQFLQLNKSDNTGSASITFSAPSYTVINSYSFLVFSNNTDRKPTYQINDDKAVSPTGDLNNPNTVQKSDYSTQTLKITTIIDRVLGFFQYNYYYVRMKQFDFTILIPEVQSGQQTTTTTLTKLSNADLAGGTKTRTGNLSFYVKDPIDTSDPTKYFAAEIVEPTDASEKSHWSVATSGWSIKETGKTETVNGRTVKIYEVVVPVTYNAGASPVVGTYSATVRLSSRNDRNTTTADQMAQITVGDVKAENPLGWGYTWENNGTVSFYKGDTYQRTDYLVNTAGQILEIPQSSNADVVYIEPLNGNIVAKSEGTAVITYTQPETEMYKEKKLTLTVTVVKHTPAFTIYSEERDGDKYVFYVNKSYSPFISTTNTDLSDYSISVTHNAAQYIEIDNLDAQTKSNVATFDVTISQAEGDLWYEKTETFTIELRHNPIHVGTLCDRTLEEKFADNRFSIDKNNNAVYRDGAIFLGSTAGGSNGGSITFHFVGTPDKLEITTATSSGSPSWTYKQSKTEYDADFYDLKNFTFDDDARYLKVIVSGSQAVGKITALCITERVGVSVSPTDVSLIAVDNTVSAGKLNVSIINLETVSLKVSGENAEDFKLVCGTHSYTSQSGLTLDYTDGLGIDCSPVVPVEIQYVGDYASAVGKTAQVDITDGNGHTATVSVKIQSIAQNEYGVPSSIYASMATTTGIETGTEHKTNNNHPYHLKKAVNLTGAFAGGAACFDKLYIFGVTKGYTSAGEETTTINRYSKTPCYVYAKNGDHYDFEQYVENMNSDTKGIGINVAANGQKLYFTGWCPYASAGYLPSDIGAFHIKGGAGAKVDVYLDNCYLFVRDKTINHKSDADETQAKTKFGNYPTGSGGAFVFETTSTNSGSPFTPMVHLRGENILRSTHGNRVYVSFVGQVKTATQISSPIHMYTTSTSQYETLTIDDKWPTNAAGTETENVNGSLRLTKKTSNSPSIDLGNANSVVNFNGGQVYLQNALPLSTAYSSTMAISWRSYSQYGLTIYGIGTDQASGEVNFNDGTISATPIDQTSWSASSAEAYKGYYWDNESMKCPKNTHINGGSYNCNIWACSSFDDKGSSVTDCKGTSLCKKRVKISGVEDNGMAIFDFPYSESGDDGQTLESYYKNNGFLYGHNSITADEEDFVNLMLPCSYIGSEAVVSKLVIPWAMCVPALAAGAGNNTSKTFGGDITVLNDETHEVNNFVWTRIDGNMEDIIDGGNYTSPEYGATIKFQGDPHDYSQVDNAEYYTIQNDLHIIMPAVADNWMTFTAPFDVKKVYVLESYPDSILQTKSRDEALQLQAKANVDFAYFLAFYVLGVEPMSTSPLSGLYNSWLSYEYGQDTLATGFLKKDDKGKWLSRANYEKKYRGKRELVAYNGTNGAKANFYVYIAEGDTWQLKGNAVEPNWKCIDIGEDGVLFKKGQTYSLLFPYCVGCWTEDEKIDGRNYWDYWSGKLLIFEGDGPQTVYGKNHQNDLLSATAATNTVSISGNSTFADMTSSSKDIWTFGNEIGDESFAANTDGYENIIDPATAFLINGIQSKAGAAPKRINLRSGAVTYEGNANAETGVPTIAGGHSLIVNSVAGGVEVIPVEAQQVGIYGSAGQLIASDYMTDETTLSLPAGIYMVRGEKETAKVIVR